MLSTIRRKVNAGERIDQEEALFLLTEADLLDLAPLSQQWRYRHNPERRVTFVVDTNLNYTNVCDAYCTFCAFYRADPDHADAYTYTVAQMMEQIGTAVSKGVTTVLMQGGLNSALPLEYYVEMVSETVRLFPQVTPHYFSAPEIMKMTDVSGKSIGEVFQALKSAGYRSLPGGGSEILSNRVKAEISRFRPKGKVDDWTRVHEEAHAAGLRSTATMMYGHIETQKEIIESLGHIRAVQDKADDSGQPGFTAFIPWSYKRDNTGLAQKVKQESGPNEYLRAIAVSRIFLDNVQHIQASWFSEGRKTGQVALHFGADDFGGTLFDENVMQAAGFYNRTTIDEIKNVIADAGFTPAQRTTEYDILELFDGHLSGEPGSVPLTVASGD